MYEVLDKDTIKFEILPPLICGKTWFRNEKYTL